MTITLPDNTLWLDGGLGVAIVQGDRQKEMLNMGGNTWTAGQDGHVAPQAWAQYDKPCELCEGDGWLREYNGMDPNLTRVKCRHCRDGRQVWTVRWFDKGERFKRKSQFIETRATIQVVPVVADAPGLQLSGLAVIVDEHGAWLSDGTPLPLDPLPTPGRDFAVIVRVAS